MKLHTAQVSNTSEPTHFCNSPYTAKIPAHSKVASHYKQLTHTKLKTYQRTMRTMPHRSHFCHRQYWSFYANKQAKPTAAWDVAKLAIKTPSSTSTATAFTFDALVSMKHYSFPISIALSAHSYAITTSTICGTPRPTSHLRYAKTKVLQA